MIDFLIMTALQKEFGPLRDVFKAKRLPKNPKDTYQYYEATVKTNTRISYSVRLVCAGGKGSAYTTATLASAVPKWKPRHVIMTGIAATVPGETRHIGEVLVADIIVDLSEWKVLPSEYRVRPAIHECDFELVGSVSHFLDSPRHIKAHIGVIVAQTYLVKSADFRKTLVGLAKKVTGRKGDVIGVEMEGGGLGIGIKTLPRDLRPGFLMIKGAVDFANYHKNDAAQKQAAYNAAQFVWDFLFYGPVGTILEDQQVITEMEKAAKDSEARGNTIHTRGNYSPGKVGGDFVIAEEKLAKQKPRKRRECKGQSDIIDTKGSFSPGKVGGNYILSKVHEEKN